MRHDVTEDKRIRVQVLLDPECDIPGVPPVQSLGLNEELSKLSIIHVAGTKGKGSTCAMVESMLRTAGYRTGLFTSPHLLDVRERIRIDGYGSFRPRRDLLLRLTISMIIALTFVHMTAAVCRWRKQPSYRTFGGA